MQLDLVRQQNPKEACTFRRSVSRTCDGRSSEAQGPAGRIARS